jgi:hypothetical protein
MRVVQPLQVRRYDSIHVASTRHYLEYVFDASRTPPLCPLGGFPEESLLSQVALHVATCALVVQHAATQRS